MKKANVLVVLVVVVVAVLAGLVTGCINNLKASKADVSKKEAASESAQEDVLDKDIDKELIYDVLQTIYDVKPGTAGDSLRMMNAVGKFMDLSATLTDKYDANDLTSYAYEWAKENDKDPSAFDEAYISVRELAFECISNPDQYKSEILDSGYELKNETYSKDYLEYVTNYIEVSRNTAE